MYSVNNGQFNFTRISEDLIRIVESQVLEESLSNESVDIVIAEVVQQVVTRKTNTNVRRKSLEINKKSIKAAPYEKRTLILADEFFESEEFKKAKNLYKAIINSKDLFNDLQPTSCCEILQNNHICRMKLWLNESQFEKKNKLLLKSLASLKLCLNSCETTSQNKKNIFNDFAYHLFKRGEDLLDENHPISSFVHFKLLLQVDLSFIKFIDGFDEIVKIILLSMRDCIISQENKKSGSSEQMNNEMINLIDNPLINLELQVEHKRWLMQTWEHLSENNNDNTMMVEEKINELSHCGHNKIVNSGIFEIVHALDTDENLNEIEIGEGESSIEIDVERETDSYIIFKDSKIYSQWIEEKVNPYELFLR